MNYNSILNDTIVGAITFSIASYLNQLYSETDDVVRVFAFLWATPLSYFIFLNLFKSRGGDAMIEFTKHAALGVVCLMVAMGLTIYYIDKMSPEDIVYLNLVYTLIVTSAYFIFKIYKKGVI